MPRYFFAIRWSNGHIEDDPHGMILPNDTAALSYAECAIQKFRKADTWDHPGPMMIVQSESHQTLLSLPFLPGCA